MKYSLAQQHQALMHCVAFAMSDVSETVIEAAEEGVNSFRFLRDHRDAFVALHRVLERFPEAEIEVLTDGYNNGSGAE